jgi:lipopolysaccharide/colanic/teichoic acid biosynthesis glycosyltransferase
VQDAHPAGSQILKRAFDVAVAGCALVALAPLLVVIGAAIRLSTPGPALYRSPRMGLNGRTFTMWKFRTMTPGAADLRNADGSTYAGPNDPRVTQFGRWLRRTSLDELPQLWNVLRGEMSIVGPRPELPDQVRFYAPGERRRLDVRPGLTGLAQISGRNDLTWADRRALDVEYVEGRSFAGDLRILARTLPAVLRGGGVYSAAGREAHDDSRRG